MDILEILAQSLDPIPITLLQRKIYVSNTKANFLLQHMQKLEWIKVTFNGTQDHRFSIFYTIDAKGSEIFSIYNQKIRKLLIKIQ